MLLAANPETPDACCLLFLLYVCWQDTVFALWSRWRCSMFSRGISGPWALWRVASVREGMYVPSPINPSIFPTGQFAFHTGEGAFWCAVLPSPKPGPKKLCLFPNLWQYCMLTGISSCFHLFSEFANRGEGKAVKEIGKKWKNNKWIFFFHS